MLRSNSYKEVEMQLEPRVDVPPPGKWQCGLWPPWASDSAMWPESLTEAVTRQAYVISSSTDQCWGVQSTLGGQIFVT